MPLSSPETVDVERDFTLTVLVFDLETMQALPGFAADFLCLEDGLEKITEPTETDVNGMARVTMRAKAARDYQIDFSAGGEIDGVPQSASRLKILVRAVLPDSDEVTPRLSRKTLNEAVQMDRILDEKPSTTPPSSSDSTYPETSVSDDYKRSTLRIDKKKEASRLPLRPGIRQAALASLAVATALVAYLLVTRDSPPQVHCKAQDVDGQLVYHCQPW